MKASTTYHMRSQVQCDEWLEEATDDLTFKTGPLPNSPFPTIAVQSANPSSESPENPGIEMIDVISPNDNYVQALFTDRDGNPIWYYPLEPNYSPETIKFLPNGGLIFSLVNGPDSRLREVDLGGNTIRELDITELPAARSECRNRFRARQLAPRCAASCQRPLNCPGKFRQRVHRPSPDIRAQFKWWATG